MQAGRGCEQNAGAKRCGKRYPFAFDAGEEISTHESTGDAFVTVLEGTGIFTVDGVEHTVSAGQSLLMPAKKPHSVRGDEAFKWMLVVVFPKRQ